MNAKFQLATIKLNYVFIYLNDIVDTVISVMSNEIKCTKYFVWFEYDSSFFIITN